MADTYTLSLDFDSADRENKKHTIRSPNGLVRAAFINRGATLVEFAIKQADNSFKNVTLGFQTGDEYRTRTDNPYFGALAGRVANRVRDAKFVLDGVEYQLAANNGLNSLHGGLRGFDKVNFTGPHVEVLTSPPTTTSSSAKLKFSYLSTHLEENYPGDLDLAVSYWLEDRDGGATLNFEYEARLVGPDGIDHTILNLTNHAYYNVGAKPTIEGVQVTLGATDSLVVDSNLIPTGAIKPYPGINNTTFTFGPAGTVPDVDDCFVFSDVDTTKLDTRNLPFRQMAHVYSDQTKINLVGHTTEPAFQFYTGRFVNTPEYPHHSGLCLESSRYVDAINRPEWQAQWILGKNQVYGSKTKYELYI
ncbi:galactose mutarotase-like domain-containing protein [Lipomyces japonicus]|uniref:galactose mutarotase-like domain-containing protein n=1 Tax=Lipomyces japonicus TaxID=56871 RepID=UPI0034CE440D